MGSVWGIEFWGMCMSPVLEFMMMDKRGNETDGFVQVVRAALAEPFFRGAVFKRHVQRDLNVSFRDALWRAGIINPLREAGHLFANPIDVRYDRT